MNYKVIGVDDKTLTLEDSENLDEWGKPSTLQFIMSDTSCFKIGQPVQIMIVSRR